MRGERWLPTYRFAVSPCLMVNETAGIARRSLAIKKDTSECFAIEYAVIKVGQDRNTHARVYSCIQVCFPRRTYYDPPIQSCSYRLLSDLFWILLHFRDFVTHFLPLSKDDASLQFLISTVKIIIYDYGMISSWCACVFDFSRGSS